MENLKLSRSSLLTKFKNYHLNNKRKNTVVFLSEIKGTYPNLSCKKPQEYYNKKH